MDSRMDSRTQRLLSRRSLGRGAAPFLLALSLGLVAVIALGGVAFADSSDPSNAAATYTGHWTQPAHAPGMQPANESANIALYAGQYGFFTPKAAVAIASDETARLAVLIPYARVAAAQVNSRYGAALQPEMVLWWTHADGIRARVNYSNCANEQDQYFSHLHNCDKPWFWQLGAAADQFSYVVYLPLAVDDMYGPGAANNAALIQRLGQQVLDFDQRVGATPACGGYPCTFPTTTIGVLMQNVSLKAQTNANWYASVLMRDPGVGSWMTARALRNFSHAQTRDWVGCYYAASCWQRLSDRMGDILSAWPSLARLAATLPPGDPVNPAPTATPTTMPTATPTATDTATATPTDTPAPTATATPTDTPAPTATATPTIEPTITPTATDTATATPTATDTPAATPTDTPTDPPAATPTAASTPITTPTDTPTAAPTDAATATPTPSPTAPPTDTPSPTATVTPPADGPIPCRWPIAGPPLESNSRVAAIPLSADTPEAPLCPI